MGWFTSDESKTEDTLNGDVEAAENGVTAKLTAGAKWIWNNAIVGVFTYTANTAFQLLEQGLALRKAVPTLVKNPEARKIVRGMAHVLVYDVLPLVSLNAINNQVQGYFQEDQDEMTGLSPYSVFLTGLTLVNYTVVAFTWRQGAQASVRILLLDSLGPPAFNSNKITRPPSLCTELKCTVKREVKGWGREPLVLLGNDLLTAGISYVPYLGPPVSRVLSVYFIGRYITRLTTPERCERHKAMMQESVLALGLGYEATTMIMDAFLDATIGMPPFLYYRVMRHLLLLLHVNVAAHMTLPLVLPGCDLHLMSELPKNLAQYKNSYIFIKKNDTRELYYIQPDGEYEEAKIIDFNLFEEKISTIKNKDRTKLHLSEEQIKEIVTSNGGHTLLPKYMDPLNIYERISRFIADVIFDGLKVRIPKDFKLEEGAKPLIPLSTGLKFATKVLRSDLESEQALTPPGFFKRSIDAAKPWVLPPMFRDATSFINDRVVADHWLALRDGTISTVEIIGSVGKVNVTPTATAIIAIVRHALSKSKGETIGKTALLTATWTPRFTAKALNYKWGIPRSVTLTALKLSKKEDFWDLADAIKAWCQRHNMPLEVKLVEKSQVPLLGEKKVEPLPEQLESSPLIPPQDLISERRDSSTVVAQITNAQELIPQRRSSLTIETPVINAEELISERGVSLKVETSVISAEQLMSERRTVLQPETVSSRELKKPSNVTSPEMLFTLRKRPSASTQSDIVPVPEEERVNGAYY
ncbi:hypothetical protein [Legionella maioricensis]|uniref:hypothetical protein n=1 Tax=Legionella maioricensis TaxID=2896528 RepID=UPI0025425323|nr:hypothetical protein [Legionella maioricensis]